jgi:hypothetical protein
MGQSAGGMEPLKCLTDLLPPSYTASMLRSVTFYFSYRYASSTGRGAELERD